MRTAFALLSLFFLTTQSKAETFKVETLGAGAASCATWLSSPTSERQGEQWILGFWTGSNWVALTYGTKRNVGYSTDNLGLIGEVKKRCLNSPSQTLGTIVTDVFNQFFKAGR